MLLDEQAVEVAAAGRIAEAEASLGRQLTPEERRRAFQVAVLETRSAKVHGAESDVGLHDRWRAEAAQVGLDPTSWVPQALNRRPEAPVVEPSEAVDEVLGELATARSTWRRADVVREAARHTPSTLGDADAARRWIEATTEAVLSHPGVVALAAPAPQPPAELVRRDGRCVFDRHDATRYTTLAPSRSNSGWSTWPRQGGDRVGRWPRWTRWRGPSAERRWVTTKPPRCGP